MRFETSALLVEVVASAFARSFEVVVPELAATVVEDVLFVAEDGDAALCVALVAASSLATEVEGVPTVIEGVAVLPLVSLAFELSVELDFVESFAATVAEVSDLVVSDFDVSAAATFVDVSDLVASDFEASAVVDVVLELGDVVVAIDALLLDGVEVFALSELLEVDEDGLVVLAVLFVELYGVDVVAAVEFEVVEFWLLVEAAVFVVFDVSVVAVVEALGLV